MTDPSTPEAPAAPLRIFFLDDHGVVIQSMTTTLHAYTDDLRVVGSAGTEDDAWDDLQRMVPAGEVDVAVVDLSLRSGDGMDLVRRVHGAHPEFPMLVMSMKDEALFGPDAEKAGAAGFLHKGADIEAAIRAIRTVGRGGTYFGYADGEGALDAADAFLAFSDREREVGVCLGKGMNPERIARTLNIAVGTIKTHRRNMCQKVNVATFDELTEICTARMLWAETSGI